MLYHPSARMKQDWLERVNKLCFTFAEFFDILTESGIFSDYGDNIVSLSYKGRFLKII